MELYGCGWYPLLPFIVPVQSGMWPEHVAYASLLIHVRPPVQALKHLSPFDKPTQARSRAESGMEPDVSRIWGRMARKKCSDRCEPIVITEFFVFFPLHLWKYDPGQLSCRADPQRTF